MSIDAVVIRTVTIRLDSLLKFAGLAGTGGEAKRLIQSGRVHVNGEPETHRSRTLLPGDRVALHDEHGKLSRILEVHSA